ALSSLSLHDALPISSHRRVPPDSLTPRAKTHNYLNLIVADQEVQSIDPEAWAVLLDVNGNLAEGLGSNIFIVRGDDLVTPREKRSEEHTSELQSLTN